MHIPIFFCRQWRDVGEQPSRWAKIDLFFEGPAEDVELPQVELHQVELHQVELHQVSR